MCPLSCNYYLSKPVHRRKGKICPETTPFKVTVTKLVVVTRNVFSTSFNLSIKSARIKSSDQSDTLPIKSDPPTNTVSKSHNAIIFMMWMYDWIHKPDSKYKTADQKYCLTRWIGKNEKGLSYSAIWIFLKLTYNYNACFMRNVLICKMHVGMTNIRY